MKKIYDWILVFFHSIMIRISIALYNTEIEILKADPNNLGENNKKNQRMRHRNETFEKFYAGQKDEKFTQDYYEILKKADLFIKNATPFKMGVAADKHGMNYAMPDKYGRVYEHLGFYDTKSKYSGKTINEVIQEEMINRRTNDDDYELLYIFNNIPIETGLVKITDDMDSSVGTSFKLEELIVKSKQFEFPMKIYRTDIKVINKIEQITEFLHVKKIGFDFVLLEFFIPLKFRTKDINEDSYIFKELINIEQVFFKDKYGKLIAFKVNEFVKRVEFNNSHEVFKFNGNIMDVIN